MRRMRSKLNNLVYPTDGASHAPSGEMHSVGPNRQTSAIQSQLQAAGIYPQQMMPEMYSPGGYAHPYEQQQYPHMQPGMMPQMPQAPMAPQMQMHQQAQMPQANMYPAAQPQGYPQGQPHGHPQGRADGQPMTQAAPSSDMNHVTAGLDRLAANIQQLAANNPVGGQDASQVQKQNEMITAELMELRKQIAMSSEQGNNQDLLSQMEAIRQAVEAALAKSSNPEAFASAVEASHKKISDELYEFKNALSNNNANPEVFAHTFEARHDEISRSINDLQHSINAAIGNPGLYAETVENSHRELAQQFEDFKHSMLEQAAANPLPEEPDFSNLEMRLEEITRAIVALSAGNQGQDGIERIEARISDLAKSISSPQVVGDALDMPNLDEQFNQVHHNFRMLDSRLDELQTNERSDTGSLDIQIQRISDKMDALSEANNEANQTPNQGIEGLEQHITLMSEKLDNIVSITGEKFEAGMIDAQSSGDNTALISRLDELVGEVVNLRTNQPSTDTHTDQIIAHLKELSQSVDNLSQRDASAMQSADLSSLETQISEISNHLNSASGSSSIEGMPMDEISQRLTGIEQQIGASRDIAIELASQAATDAVQKTMNESPSGAANFEGADNSALQEISQNIQNLNEQTASAHAQYIEQLDAMKSSLTELANRNDKLESKFGNQDAQTGSFEDDQENAVVIEGSAHEETHSDQSIQEQEVAQYDEILEQAHSEHSSEVSLEQADETVAQSPLVTQFNDASQDENEAVEIAEEVFEQDNHHDYQDQQDDYHDHEEFHEEFSHARLPEPEETSTADLINKIRENARAEQSQSEEMIAGEKTPIQAEQVLAEAAGIKTEQPDHVEEYNSNMAQSTYDQAISQEVTPNYEEMAIEEPPHAIEETVTLGMLPQSNIQQSHYDENAPAQPHGRLPDVDVPSLDGDHEDDMPIEPGSAGPDLAELVRQVNERRIDSAQNDLGGSGSDFLASARRAAQAAAQEANLVEEEDEQNEKKGLLSKLPGILSGKKKYLLMGVAAIALFAIAMPFITGSSNSPSQELANEKTVIIENSTTANAADSDSVFSDEPVVEEDQANLGEQEQEISIDDSVDTSIIAPATAAENVDQTAAENVDQTAPVEVKSSQEMAQSEVTQPAPETIPTLQYDVSELGFASAGLKEAIQQGDLNAMFEVGRLYTNGETTKKDLAKAATWYERAATHGHAPAQYMIGNFNEKGFGMAPNVDNAVSWYEKAASQGNVIAMHNLGVLYATPGRLSEEADLDQAYIWFKKAADHGVRDSQVNMGIFHTQGLGTEVNLTEAYKWFSIASTGGDADAKKKQLIIEERLRPEQKQEAKALVENWSAIKADPAINEVITPDSWKIASAAKPVAKLDRKTIQQTQAVLNKLGYKAGTPDGIMGKQTKTAISKYQQTEGLKVTGTINPELVKSLIAKMSG